MELADTKSQDAARDRTIEQDFYVHVKGAYVGTVRCTFAQITAAFPYSVLTNGCRVHAWGKPQF